MDPTTWPLWAQLSAAGLGPSLAAAWMAKMYVAANKAHHATRDTHEASAKAQATLYAESTKSQAEGFATMLRSQADGFAATLKSQAESFSAALKSQDEDHRKQNAELTSRFVALIETQSEASVKLLESIKRQRAGGGKGERVE